MGNTGREREGLRGLRQRLLGATALVAAMSPGGAWAAACTASDAASLGAAIAGANAGACDNGTITITSNIALTASTQAITRSIAIEGNGFTIDGQGQYQLLTVSGGTVTISDVTLQNGLARGPAGGGSSGGGLGAGGALFVDNGADVTVIDVIFAGNTAEGGVGGNAGSTGAPAGFGEGGPGEGGGPGGPPGFGGGAGGAKATLLLSGSGSGSSGGGVVDIVGPGGGGAGLGGALFVRQGGSLTIAGGSISGSQVIGGSAGQIPDGYTTLAEPEDGQGIGEALFFMSGAGAVAPTLQAQTGGTLTIDETILDEGEGHVGLVIGDAGGVRTGTVALNGMVAPSGGTTVNPGTLLVGDMAGSAAALFGPVSLNGGILGGHGRVSGAVTNNNGVLAPGNSIGTLTVDSYSQGAGGVFLAEIAPGEADKLTVAGLADLAGTAAIHFLPGIYANNTYTLIEAGTISGTFDNLVLVDMPAGWLADLSYTPNEVLLTLQALLATQIGAAFGMEDVGSALDEVVLGGGGAEIAALWSAFVALSPAEQQKALTSMAGGGQSTSTSTTLRAAARAVNDLMLQRGLQPGGGPATPVQLAFSGGPQALAEVLAGLADTPEPTPDHGLWLRGYGAFGRADGDATPGSRSRGGGVLAGYDRAIGHGVTLGAMIGYGRTDMDMDDGGGSSAVDSYRAGLYGGWTGARLGVAATVSYAYNDFAASRRVAAGGTSVTASSAYHGHEFAAAAEANYRIPAGPSVLMPYLGVAYGHFTESGYVEQGAGAFNLATNDARSDSLRPSAGLRVEHPLPLGGTHEPTLLASAGLSHEMLETDRQNFARFEGGTTPFAMPSDAEDRTAVDLGARITGRFGAGSSAFLHYETRLSENRQDHLFGLGMKIAF